ncbi:MAG: alpha-hydroxy acid oxidase [Pseudochelatococcus sp.]|jgi:L-lactate dehydrogenase (cytochrome)|uniref:alpha-hydroxy acid oxidase n=1 Tax=Pseudochelatococcus sp. TaxID=2020869 RepID=UPI003D9351F5
MNARNRWSFPERPPRAMRRIFSLEDLEPAARRFLPAPVFGYVSGGAETLAAMRDNRAVFDEIGFVPRALRDVSARQLECPLFDGRHALPFGIAPMGVSALTGYRGDISLAAAARRANIPMIVSAASLIRFEDIVAANPDAWYQGYLSAQEDGIAALLARVAAAGVTTFVMTVDANVVPSRENNLRDGYRTPLRPNFALFRSGVTHPRWAVGTFLRTFLHGMPHFENAGAARGAPLLSRQAVRDFSGRESTSWDVLRFVRGRWKGRLIVKGLLAPGDVRRARESGADGVILSNHGGRQLDYTVSPMRGLRAAVSVAGGMPVMIDSGFRRGTDILKALALGARFVFLGRPFNYAAALGGADGVSHAIALMGSQLHADLGMLGLTGLEQIGPEHLFLSGFRELPADCQSAFR